MFSLLVGALLTREAKAQSDESDIAKQTQNPGAVLVSFPFQFNFNGNIGPYHRTQTLLNIQPVLPVPFSKKYALITRWITPVLSQPVPTSSTSSTSGIGDLNPQLFLAANLENKMTLGVGAALSLPTASDVTLGTGKFSVGPSLLAVYNGTTLVAGALLTTASSIGGDPTRARVGMATLQPFLNHNFSDGSYLVTAPQIFWNWEQSQWTIPLGGGAGKVYQFGETPVNINAQAYYNVASPDLGPDWQVRLALQFVYPQKVKASPKPPNEPPPPSPD